jgi:hypothetical protein
MFSSFMLFACFVVEIPAIWLRLCRASSFVVEFFS